MCGVLRRAHGRAHEKDKHTMMCRKERLVISEKAKNDAEADSLCSGTVEQRNPFFSAKNTRTLPHPENMKTRSR
jgi:hypothetical protein